MSILISGPTYLYGVNMLVIHNATKAESVLNKKYNPIAYHAVCKSVAMRKSLRGHIRPEDNPTVLLTKVITGKK